MSMTKLQAGAVAVLVIAAASIPIMWQRQQNKRLEVENAALQKQAAEATQLRGENQRLSNALKSSTGLSQADLRDLMRLRAQATAMSQVEQNNAQLKAERDQLKSQLSLVSRVTGTPPIQTPEEATRLAKISYVKQWGLALMMFAEDNGNRLPTNLTAAVSFLNTNAMHASAAPFGIQDDQFELVYQGSLTQVKNAGDAILMKEKAPTQRADGQWEKVYLFCDAHVEVQVTTDGNFDAWEKEHMPTEVPLTAAPSMP